jgi:hypothetical protein
MHDITKLTEGWNISECEPVHGQNDEANELPEMGMAIISAVLSSDKDLSETNTSCILKYCYISVLSHLLLP